jgi:TolC family type I secretion outer membrane protein
MSPRALLLLRRAAVAAAAVSVMAALGCVQTPPKLYGEPSTSPAPEQPWVPPARVEQVPAATAESPVIPQDLLDRAQSLTLVDVVDLALRNSPQTAQAWSQARSAAAAYGSQKGAYYPQVNIGAGVSRAEGSLANGAISYFQRSYAPTADLSWLLYDFGGREAALAEKRQALLTADWLHNASIQNVILEVQQAFFDYVSAKALLTAQEATVKEAETNLASAQEKHAAGVATIADVLQAKTQLSQAQLAADGLRGTIQTTRGVLATAMGFPASIPYDVAVLPSDLPVEETSEAVDRFLEQAEAKRPDLAAARAQVAQAQAHLDKVKAEGYPTLNGTASLGRTFYDSSYSYGNTYQMGIQLRFPLFTGFSHSYDVVQARADLQTAEAQFKSRQQVVDLEVWTSYYRLKTAAQQVKTSEDLFQSATQSQEVASGRYKAGVGSILDLLAAQAALENARGQRIQARANWFTSLAQLSYSTGTLARDIKALKLNITPDTKKEGQP